jgi:hypothetical protein
MPTSQTVSRSLVELKTLDGRMKKLLDCGKFIEYKTMSHCPSLDEETFRRSSTAAYQSYYGLAARRDLINYLVNESNNRTMVTIGEKEMTISSAISLKKTNEAKIKLLDVLKKQRQTVIIEKAAHEERLKANVDLNVRAIYGKGKPDVGIVATISDGLAANDPFEVLDPLNIDEIIKHMEEDVLVFEKDVDKVLSESNARTTITIPDKW